MKHERSLVGQIAAAGLGLAALFTIATASACEFGDRRCVNGRLLQCTAINTWYDIGACHHDDATESGWRMSAVRHAVPRNMSVARLAVVASTDSGSRSD
jgi:hypothetical protein